MKHRWSANTWLLIVLFAVLILTGVDVGRRMMLGAAVERKQTENLLAPAFKVGDLAPDFALPDKAGKPHKLSEMVKGDTLLCFTCGCNNCRTAQTYLANLLRKSRVAKPDVMTVTTQKPEFEERYIEQTGLQQRFLYVGTNIEVMERYKGHPCPRFFRLNGARKVTWIGPSLAEYPEGGLAMVGIETARQLGFRAAGEGDSKKPLMPPMPMVSAPTPPGKKGAAVPGLLSGEPPKSPLVTPPPAGRHHPGT
jgi:hypothetical protein